MRVVWHVAAMGNWREVAEEQLSLLRQVGIDAADATFVGDGVGWLLSTAEQHGIRLTVIRQNPNVLHYETFAILHVEQLAKASDEPILYFHTKGVSFPDCKGRRAWRHLMQNGLIRRWKAELPELEKYDAIGVNWLDSRDKQGHHFSGNFWLARADWIRTLPDFTRYHNDVWKRARFSCETWIGVAPGMRVKSLLYRNEPFWEVDKWRWGDGSEPIGQPRPCKCNRFRQGEAFDASRDCRLCWLHAHDPRYNRLWGGDGNTTDAPSIPAEAMPAPKYLGDMLADKLAQFGLTPERVERWLGIPCGCKERQRKLNALHRWLNSKLQKSPPPRT